ncbi:MAG TPA: hypothetical protein VE553_02365, partial [Candidatus Binatia bacterium]|nr:hypothetical protein [Candidatus Binatia bacterium]
VSKKLAAESLLREGDRIRAGGQLAFDAHAVRYVLLVRHLEVLASRTANETPSSDATAAASAGLAPETTLARAPLPAWVLKLAPPEIQHELGRFSEMGSADASQLQAPAEAAGRGAGTKAPPMRDAENGMPDDESLAGLPQDMVRFLSQAIDSEEDVELTRDMLASFASKESRDTAGDRDILPDEEPALTVTRDSADDSVEQEDVEGGAGASIGAWLSSPQLYLIPLLMFLIFLIAAFVFILLQQ